MITFFSLLITTLVNISDSQNLIEWKENKKLSWSDFQGKPDINSTNAALTNTSINFEYGYNQKGFTHSIKCRFNKLKSWGRIKNDVILAHEQGHFDIAELHARKLAKALSEYRFNERTVANDLNKIYDEVMKNHHSFQQQYDRETDHSRITEKQLEWEKQISTQLNQHAEYKNYATQQ